MATQAIPVKMSGPGVPWPSHVNGPTADLPKTHLPKNDRQKTTSAVLDARFWTGEKKLAVESKISYPQKILQLLLPRIFFKSAALAIDGFAIILSSVLLSYAEKVYGIEGIGVTSTRRPELQGYLVLLSAIIFVLLANAEGLYGSIPANAERKKNIVLAKCVVWAMLPACAAAIFLDGGSAFLFLLTLAPISCTVLYGWRQLFSPLRRRRPARVLIVGSGNLARNLAIQVEQHGAYTFLGFVESGETGASNALGGVEDLFDIVRSTFADGIILAIPRHPEIAARVVGMARSLNIAATLAIETFAYSNSNEDMEKVGDVWLLPILQQQEPLSQVFIKRSLDLIISAICLVLSLPLLGVIALIVKLDSSGPVLYRSLRAGRKGQLFSCYKFRTMRSDADQHKEKLRVCNERSGPIFKLTHDPRITRSGKFLRRYSLDELPQLWNVLRGEMSLVGPRPHPLDDCQRYELEHLRRLEAIPGITGLWQVTARRDPSFHRNMALDLEYIEHGTLWTDLKVLFKTVSVVLQGNGV